ncbi:TIGR02391 family protein (plasmid) [Roseomonas mucosa]|nr:TIGR02391 family protein [Roseomonas mucosa]
MLFEQVHLDAIARALAEDGLTGAEIGHLLRVCHMGNEDPGTGVTKWKRLQIAFATRQNTAQNNRAIQEFIRQAMAPANHLSAPDRHEAMRFRLNKALLLAGLYCTEEGKLEVAEAATTLSQAESRARAMRAGLERRNVHPEVLRFCSAEWLADDYFHAVQEAVKGVMDRLRKSTGLSTDGSELISFVLGGETPMLAINPRRTKSERDEQKGFVNLLIGVYGMFRNPMSHEARIHWPMSQQDAEDIMSMVSLLHRRLDGATMPPRV